MNKDKLVSISNELFDNLVWHAAHSRRVPYLNSTPLLVRCVNHASEFDVVSVNGANNPVMSVVTGREVDRSSIFMWAFMPFSICPTYIKNGENVFTDSNKQILRMTLLGSFKDGNHGITMENTSMVLSLSYMQIKHINYSAYRFTVSDSDVIMQLDVASQYHAMEIVNWMLQQQRHITKCVLRSMFGFVEIHRGMYKNEDECPA